MTNLNRREFMGLIAGGVAAIPLAGCSNNLKKNKTARRPNIIFLLTDDQRWDTMGCMGNQIIQTPNMDRIAGDGALFENAYVTTSICCASRASIFTGQYARRHGIHNFGVDFSADALAQTYPALLRRDGYRTGFIGKFGIGENMPVDNFDFWRGFGGQGKYDHKDKDGNYIFLTQLMGNQAAEFLQGCGEKQPFCLSISFKAPHVQGTNDFVYDPAYRQLYKDKVIPAPKTAEPKYFEALPKFLRESEARLRWVPRFSTEEKFQENVKAYYRLITGVDTAIGHIRDELGRLELDDNTVIILIGDNGFYLGEHGLAGKWFGHKESIRVPLIIYDPRLPAKSRGQKHRQIALNIDIAPTILALAGRDIPKTMQGRSLMELVDQRAVEWRKDFFYEHLCSQFKTIPKSEGLVGQRWKYMRYFEQKPVYEQLYDLKKDSFEVQNLAKNKKYRGILASMRKRCNELAAEVK